MSTVGKPIKCQAAVVWKVGETYSIETVEVDVPKKGEVRIKISSTGCCHSDLHLQDGLDKNLKFPAVLGHEAAGFVESIGEDVTRVEPGDLVVLAFEAHCGECLLCKKPEAYMCLKQPRNHLQMDGTSRFTAKGEIISQMMSLSTFSEYTVTSQYNVAKVNPKANPNNLCLAGCCLPTGYGAAMNAAKVTPGSTVAVWGLGGVGMCVIMGCRDSGAARIIGIDINPRKFNWAKQFGATEFLNPNEVQNVSQALNEMVEGGPDFCFVSVGILSVMKEAFKSSNRFWGKTVIIGIADLGSTLAIGVWDLIFGRKIVGTYGGSYKLSRDIPSLVNKVSNGEIQIEKLITQRIKLEEINKGFSMLKSGESIRTVIEFES